MNIQDKGQTSKARVTGKNTTPIKRNRVIINIRNPFGYLGLTLNSLRLESVTTGVFVCIKWKDDCIK